MEKKIIYIPGWMNTLGTYGNPDGVEIWNGDFNINKETRADYIVGHSIGANFALENRRRKEKGKLILVNPLLPKRNFLKWYLRLRKFHSNEGYNPKGEHPKGFLKAIAGCLNGVWLLRKDPKLAFSKIPKDDIIVIRGKKDLFFCDDVAIDFIRKFNIKLIEVDNAGHGWCDKIQEEVNKLLEK